MLNKKQILEIREHLEKAQNPVFFFDNDNDGLMSFLLLRRFIGRGRGVAIKSFPELDASYYKRVSELNPDYVFILDKPVVSNEFLEKVKKDNIPIVWIDHHQVEKPNCNEIFYYNGFFSDGKNEPVSYICYNVTKKKEDIWLAIIGCVSDCYMPEFYKEFEKKYPELAKKNPKSAFDVFYNSEIGKISRILDFSLKDSTTNVVNMLRFMMRVKTPYDILEENSKTKQILKKFDELNSKYQVLIEKARTQLKGDLLYFQYSGQLSLSSNLSNQLVFENPDKVIVVVYLKGDVANISLRGEEMNIRELTLKSIEGIDGATGGGHEHATGAKMSTDDLPEFKRRIKKLVKG